MLKTVLTKGRRKETVKVGGIQPSSQDSITLQQLLGEVRMNQSQPRFVYCHFVMPHPPSFLTGRGSKHIPANGVKRRIPEYLLYTNKIILSAIDQILAQSKTPPVIMLLSDHGLGLMSIRR